ncbi:putative ADP-ribosylation factor GTPase-activating protein AGD9 [Vitis vinifera]|uniref:Putative ADP-ribosylation factor GTPase-activating protein AGD9 n=1 Tax=Vitis vinifera TaxID=29760 RepID=A0A438JZZ8_VITVI|nr:putative ADP-ribosylation factor GTPase-activating protein AGD9 [Vitis vinifera]
MMSFGGNNRAQAFFKQHGWSDGGKIEAKYTSRAAELYRQLLSKEVAKSVAEDAGLPSSPVASQSAQATNGLADFKINEAPKESSLGKQEASDVPVSPKAPHTVMSSSVKKPIGAKRTGKSSGLGARKLTTKPSENLYEQKPEEPSVPVSTSTNNTPSVGSSFASRFEYIENVQSSEMNSEGTHVLSHVSPPKSSSFFAEYGMDSGFQKKASSNSSKVQLLIVFLSLIYDPGSNSWFQHTYGEATTCTASLEIQSYSMHSTEAVSFWTLEGKKVEADSGIEESDEARRKFSNAKSISSAQYFGDPSKANDMDSQVSLQKFSGSTAISSADLFGHSSDNSPLDISASDLINRLSFQAQQDYSSLKSIAGETGKKLSSLASTLMTDLQDRIL